MTRLLDYGYIAATVALTVYGQMILKWRISQLGGMPAGGAEKVQHLFSLMLDPLVFSGFVAAFLASLTWMAAMTRFDISHAYPFMGLNFALVMLLSHVFLGEVLTLPKVCGVVMIVFGIVVMARG